MDQINQLVSPEAQANILQGLVALSALLPLLEKVAKATAWKWDDSVVGWMAKAVHGASSLIPRIMVK